MRTSIFAVFLLLIPVLCFGDVLVNDIIAHDQTLPKIAVDGSNIYIVWQDGSGFQYDVRAAVSTDGGASFSPSLLPYPANDEDQISPDIGVDESGRVFILWSDWRNLSDYDLYISSSDDHGLSFSDPIPVLNDSSGSQVSPAFATGNDEIYLAWADNHRTTGDDGGVRWDIRFSKSGDGGSSFSEPETLNVSDDVFVASPDIVATQDGAAVVWFDFLSRIWFRASNDFGDTWGEPVLLSAGDAFASFPRIASTDGRLAVVWNDARESDAGVDTHLVRNSGMCLDVYLAVSEDGGVTWTDVVRVNDERLLNQQYPAVSWNGDFLSVVWSDDREVGNYEIYGSTAETPWTTFSVSRKLDDYTGLTVRDRPDISGDAVVRQDFRDGDWNIYFRRIGE